MVLHRLHSKVPDQCCVKTSSDSWFPHLFRRHTVERSYNFVQTKTVVMLKSSFAYSSHLTPSLQRRHALQNLISKIDTKAPVPMSVDIGTGACPRFHPT